MTRKEWRERLEELKPIWAEEDRKFREMVARREQRLREWDEMSPGAAPAFAA